MLTMSEPQDSPEIIPASAHFENVGQYLSNRDPRLAPIIQKSSVVWTSTPSEDPIWGLVRIVVAQQLSTRQACGLANRIREAYPRITRPVPEIAPEPSSLRAFGLPKRRAQCCVDIIKQSDEIRTKVGRGHTWEQALAGIKGIGPWTFSVFRIMVLRDPDALALGDVGLERAIANVYGPGHDVEQLSVKWRPYRSVACWYLWRTLGNEQLG